MAEGNLSIVARIHEESRLFSPPAEQAPSPASMQLSPLGALHDHLRAWATSCPKPLVLFIDEIDSLPEDLLLSVLGQLRMGYTSRPAPFLHSAALVGVRDVRDYKVSLRPDQSSMGTSSPFNIKSESLVLRGFTRDEVAELYGQHTAETGQAFEAGAVDQAFEHTQGQPWLVNALARQITEKDVPDRSRAITARHVDAARDALILRRDTHLDSVVDKLHEPRVRRVIEPILAGIPLAMDTFNDDLLFVRDLGLIVDLPHVRIANPIYQEIIPRALTYIMQVSIREESAWYTRPDGSLDMLALLRAFQRFFAENSDAWMEKYDYKEAGPHLVLQAFLQRVIHGGGQIRREFAVGSGRVDLLVEWRSFRYAIELKVRRSDRTEAQGVEQLGRYLARLQLDEGFLVLFDRRPGVDWDAKLHEKEVAGEGGRKIFILGA